MTWQAGTAAEAAARARAAVGHHNVRGMCLFYVRTWCGAPGGFPNALAGWIGATHKHPHDANPPPGVPVWWDGGAGHVALSIGGGNIVSTDWPNLEHIGQTTIAKLSHDWGPKHHYLGWSEDIDGRLIQGIGKAAPGGPGTAPGAPPVPTSPGGPIAGLFGSVEQIQKIASWLSDSRHWIQIAMFLIGLILCLIALARMMKNSDTAKTAGSVTKKVINYAASAKS